MAKRGRPKDTTRPEKLYVLLRLPAGGAALLRRKAGKAFMPFATWASKVLLEHKED